MLWYKSDFQTIFSDASPNAIISLWRLLESVYMIQKCMALSELINFQKEIEISLKIIYLKLKNLSEKEIKEVDRDLIMRMFHYLENQFVDYKELETLELEIYKKYIFSQYFEKKLKALNDLKEFCERARLASISFQKSNRSTSAYKDFNFTRYYTVDLVINWILDQKVLENALKNTTQIDIIKRCQDLIRFVANHSTKFPQNLLIFLWGIMEEAQYEDIKKGYQDILEDLASLLDQEGLDFIFGKVEENLLEKIRNENYFNFLRKCFSRSTIKTRKILLEQLSSRTIELNSLPSNNNDNENNDFEEKKVIENKKFSEEEEILMNEEDVNLSKFFGIDLIWKFVQDDSPFHVNKINECLDFFIELLKKASIKVLYRKYFELCLENIFSNKSIYQSLYLMREILNSIQPDWNSLDFSLFLSHIQEKYGHNLIDIILKEMIISHEAIKERFENNRYSYFEIYKMHLNLFQFLKNYTISKPKNTKDSIEKINKTYFNDNLFNITYDHINILWDLSVLKAHNSSETIQFLQCFINSDSGKNSQNMIKCMDYIFDLFCKYLQEKIDTDQSNAIYEEMFKCFLTYYQHCNINHKNFEYNNNENLLMILCDDEKIIGFQTLWNLFLECEQDKIIQECYHSIVSIYSSLGYEIYPRRTEIFKKFLNKCLIYLKEAIILKKTLLIQKVLKLIDMFTVYVEKRKMMNYNKNRNNLILIKPSNDKYESFQFNSNLSVKHLRLKISEANEIPLDSFIIVFNQANMELTKECDETKVNFLINNDMLVYCVIKEGKLENPKSMILEKRDFMKTFFEIFEINFSGMFFF